MAKTAISNKYAVIRILGRQYKVTEGQELVVDKLSLASQSPGKMNDLKLVPEVLMVVDGDKVKIGKPVLKDAKVTLKVLKEMEMGEKMEVYHFKAKSRYRKHTGFRPQYTRLQIVKIA